MRKANAFKVKQIGLSLIEILIAMVIAVVLAKVAYDSYSRSVQKARRSDAVDAFIQIQQAQERYRSNNSSYASSLTTLSVSSTSTNGYYTMAISSATATGYVVTATAVSGKSQTSDMFGSISCATLTVTVSNGSSTNTPTNCWSK